MEKSLYFLYVLILMVYMIGFIGCGDSGGDGDDDDDIITPWETAEPMLTARQQLVTLTLNQKIYAISGVISGPGTILNIVEEYDLLSGLFTT